MTIGMAVEGASDAEFFDKVLHKHFPGVQFDIRNMKSSGNLLREAPALREIFRRRHHEAAYLLLDYDVVFGSEDRCPAAIIGRLDATLRAEATRPLGERYLFVCIAVKGLESWFLADQDAVLSLLPNATYSVVPDTAALPGRTLEHLWRQEHTDSFNKTQFARNIAPRFKPDIAVQHSASFRHFWERLSLKAVPSGGETGSHA